MYALAIIRYRRPIDEVLAHYDDHHAYLKMLQKEGVLVASGPLEPRYGGALLLRVPDATAQKAMDWVRDNDPYFRAGVAQYELLGWNVKTGREDLDRAMADKRDWGLGIGD